MRSVKDEFEEIVEELELLSNPGIRKRIENSLKAEKEGRTVKCSLADFKKDIGL